MRVWLAHNGKACRNSDNATNNKTKVKKETARKLHVVLIQSAVDKLTREELNRAKHGLEFAERHPVKPIVREDSPAPLRFSLASLIPAGV